MFKVILLFILGVVIWGALWLVLAVAVFNPLLGEQITSAIGALAGFAVGTLLIQWCMEYGYSKGWIKW